MTVEDVQSPGHNIFRKSLIGSRVFEGCQDAASYPLVSQYGDRQQNVAAPGVLLLLRHQILYILQQVNLYQIFHEQPYRDIYQISDRKMDGQRMQIMKMLHPRQ